MSDNIIVDTATRILADLCEPQTVNAAEEGHWPAELWNALEESGLTLARLDYVAVVDDATWEDVQRVAGPARALVAARVGPPRLIDNLLLPWEPGWAVQNSGNG